MSELNLLKAILEIRYPNAPLFLDKKGAIVDNQVVAKRLPRWKIGQQELVVHDAEGTTFYQAELDKVIIIFETPPAFQLFCDEACYFSNYVLKLLKVRKTTRIGLRLYFTLEQEKDFDDLVQGMRHKLFKIEDSQWKLLGGPPEDIGLPLTLNLGDFKVNFKLGLMVREQLQGLLLSKGNGLPETAVFVDFDIYRRDPSINFQNCEKEVKKFIQEGYDKASSMSANFIEQFGGF